MIPAAATDLELLHRFAHEGDAESFNILARRHAALVFQTCLRVLRNRDEAEDAAQETFHQLMRAPEAVSRNVPAWLHAVATAVVATAGLGCIALGVVLSFMVVRTAVAGFEVPPASTQAPAGAGLAKPEPVARLRDVR